MRRQLSAAVVASCQRLRHSVDRSLLPEAVSPYNLLLVGLEAAGPVTGLRVWNYNKSPADTARGVKRMIVLAGAPGRDEKTAQVPAIAGIAV